MRTRTFTCACRGVSANRVNEKEREKRASKREREREVRVLNARREKHGEKTGRQGERDSGGFSRRDGRCADITDK